MVSDNDKEEAWTLSCSSGWNTATSSNYWMPCQILIGAEARAVCQGADIKQSLPVWERSSGLLSNSCSADFSTHILLARATSLSLRTALHTYVI
jgi:hypothetical protein